MNGSTIFTGIKSVELLVAVKFSYNGDRCQQRFELNANKSTLHYAQDKRYEIYDKLNNKIKDVMLSNFNDTYVFYQRVDEETCITIIYDVVGKINKSLLVNYFFVIPSFLPAFCGCEYCVFANKTDASFFCNLKNKDMKKGIHRCMVFKQKTLFKT